MFKIIDICIACVEKNYSGILAHHMGSKLDENMSQNNTDIKDINNFAITINKKSSQSSGNSSN
ncbi:hypothetical protein DEO72_LG11g2309 [Vigna unguiculata]|uniref:Uncharacterized protein n=1 Tax=Vigna unguiculata TaxID=3917 RepID=A0A4D6NN80_VIGUN|nr:hypothetical protein DEO72_LG11g2309 [Vigna unguiculata]